MNSIPAQEIKRKGIAAVDPLLAKGDVHVIRSNQPQYVILTEERYQELAEAERGAYVARVKASLKDVKSGKVKNFSSVDQLLRTIDSDEEK